MMASSPNTDLEVSSGESYRDEFDPQAYLHFEYSNVTEYHSEPLRLLHEMYCSYGSTSSVVQSLEGLGEEEVAKRQEDVHKLIKAVVKCDIHMDPPIQSGYEGPYDVIVSSLCLECVCSSLEEYEVAMTKLSTLLKPGGRIVLRCVEGEDNAPTHFYIVGAHKFVALNVTESFIRSTLEKTGFYNISLKRQLQDTTGVNFPQEASDYCAMSFVTATKK